MKPNMPWKARQKLFTAPISPGAGPADNTNPCCSDVRPWNDVAPVIVILSLLLAHPRHNLNRCSFKLLWSFRYFFLSLLSFPIRRDIKEQTTLHFTWPNENVNSKRNRPDSDRSDTAQLSSLLQRDKNCSLSSFYKKSRSTLVFRLPFWGWPGWALLIGGQQSFDCFCRRLADRPIPVGLLCGSEGRQTCLRSELTELAKGLGALLPNVLFRVVQERHLERRNDSRRAEVLQIFRRILPILLVRTLLKPSQKPQLLRTRQHGPRQRDYRPQHWPRRRSRRNSCCCCRRRSRSWRRRNRRWSRGRLFLLLLFPYLRLRRRLPNLQDYHLGLGRRLLFPQDHDRRSLNLDLPIIDRDRRGLDRHPWRVHKNLGNTDGKRNQILPPATTVTGVTAVGIPAVVRVVGRVSARAGPAASVSVGRIPARAGPAAGVGGKMIHPSSPKPGPGRVVVACRSHAGQNRHRHRQHYRPACRLHGFSPFHLRRPPLPKNHYFYPYYSKSI